MIKSKEKNLVPAEIIENKIFLIRGKKVMFDSDLAVLYGVETKKLNQAVKRNADRFPEDFMFQLNKEETMDSRFQIGTLKIDEVLRSQIVTSRRGGRRYLPFVFTEPGVAMLSSVLNSERAVRVNIQIIRTFIKIREMIISNKSLREKIEEMEKKYDNKFAVVFKAITKLISQPIEEKREPIGFRIRK